MMNSNSNRKLASSSKKKTKSQCDRRSSPRRTNVIASIKHSETSQSILAFPTHESTNETKFVSSNATISSDSSCNLVLNTSENTQSKSTFWTVTDRQAYWYKLTRPAQVQHSSISQDSVSFKILSKIAPKSMKTTTAELECPTTTTQLIMKAVMKELDYDMDEEDSKFLAQLNEIKLENQDRTMSEDEFENAMIIFEYSTAENIRSYLKQRICDDEAIVCDICLLADGDDGNEMVFCERCHICVHQDCYGISVVPSGKWFCKACSILRRPNCLLCPKVGGPMASSSSGMIWCHLTCAIWLPELKFADYDKMEPILNLHQIPHARWSLRCVVCSTSEGACIQCAEKNCRTPFHVTCGLAEGFFLDVQQIKSKESQQIRSQFNAYCSKHSAQARQRSRKISSDSSSIKDGNDSSCSSSSSSSIPLSIPLTIYRRNQLKHELWLTECYKKFHTFASQTQLHDECSSNYDLLTSKKIFDYWKAKRETRGSLPLINRIDFVLEQRENADLLISQINTCLSVEKKIVELKNHSKSTIDSFTSSSSFLTQRLQWLKENFNGMPSTSRKRRCRHRSLAPTESFGGRSSKRRRQNFFYSSEHLQTIERAKHCQVLLESSYREQLQLNTTYFIVETVEGEMFLAPKTFFDRNPLMSLDDSDEIEKENEHSNTSDEEDLIRSQKAIDVFHTVMQTPYRSLGNVVTCITGSFN